MKKGLKLLGIAVLIFFIVIGAAFLYIRTQEIPNVEVSNVVLSNIVDGLYEGEYTEGAVKVSVSVGVKDNEITDITINEHQNGLGKKAEKIVDEIISEQSLNVDVISGATLSSNVIRRAVQEALSK